VLLGFATGARAAAAIAVLCLATAACNEEGTIVVKSLTFDGVKHVEESRLRDVLATKQSGRLPLIGQKRFFIRTQFDADLKRVQAFYADRGFPDARVTNVDVKLNDKQDEVRIAVSIEEGEPIRVASVSHEGFDVIPPRRLAALERRTPLRKGDPLDRQLVVAGREMAVNELKEHGYPYATVSLNDEALTVLSEAAAHPEGREVAVVYRATPGVAAVFGPIEVTGNASVSDHIIERQLTFRPGDVYRRSQLQTSQRKLYGMELFQFANIEVAEPGQQTREVPIKVTIAEGKHRRLNFGVGYGTEEKARVDTEWHHLNFFGGARTAGVHARWSSLDRGVRLDFTEPYFFSPHLSLGMEGQSWFVREPLYDADTYGGHATITHRADQTTTVALTITNELQQTTLSNAALEDLTLRDTLISLGIDPRTGFQRGTLASLGLDFQRNTTSNVLNASRGYVVSFHGESAGRLLPGNYNYFGVSGEGRYYWSIARRVVLANRVQYGTVDPAQNRDSNIPFQKRLFLGGSTSMRGWGRFNVSPLSGSGLPIGGLTLFQATSELRMPIWGKLGGVLFVDAGNVWADPWSAKLGDLRYDAGPGLRYLTPIGPLRFDVGLQLNPIDRLIVNGKRETRHFRVHFSIGQAF
jgi:outer membrane protein insertion porin family